MQVMLGLVTFMVVLSPAAAAFFIESSFSTDNMETQPTVVTNGPDTSTEKNSMDPSEGTTQISDNTTGVSNGPDKSTEKNSMKTSEGTASEPFSSTTHVSGKRPTIIKSGPNSTTMKNSMETSEGTTSEPLSAITDISVNTDTQPTSVSDEPDTSTKKNSVETSEGTTSEPLSAITDISDSVVLLPYGPSQNDSDVVNIIPHKPDDAIDDNNYQLNLPEHFMFGCKEYLTTWVNTNGYLTFNSRFTSFKPKLFPLINNSALSIIAPFWADIDLGYYEDRKQGHLYYQCYSKTINEIFLPYYKQQVFDIVTLLIQRNFGDSSYEPTLICVVTWEDVHPFPAKTSQEKTATFQVAITSDSQTFRTYIIYSYKSFMWDFINSPSSQGYQAGDKSIAAYNLSTSLSVLSENLPHMKGNTGNVGRWIFRASSPYCENEAFDSQTTFTEETSSTNFESEPTSGTKSPVKTSTIPSGQGPCATGLVGINNCNNMPDGNFQSCNTCYGYAACTAGALIMMPCPTNLLFDDTMKQCLFTSSTCTQPDLHKTDTTTTSVKTAPVSTTQINPVTSPEGPVTLLPYGPSQNDSDVVAIDPHSSGRALDDGNYQLNLPELFMFGCTEYPMFWINVNGYLTFNSSFIVFEPELFPLSDFSAVSIIAPFWADMDLRYYKDDTQGHLYYQCYSRTNESVELPTYQENVFGNVTQIIHYSLGDKDFEPTLVCVVTWEDVHPFPAKTSQDKAATFQVVIAGDSQTFRSYIIYSYKSFVWDFLKNPPVEGYQTEDDTIAALNLLTSLSDLSGNLPYMKGNTGDVGRWIFRVSSSHCENATLEPESTTVEYESSYSSFSPTQLTEGSFTTSSLETGSSTGATEGTESTISGATEGTESTMSTSFETNSDTGPVTLLPYGPSQNDSDVVAIYPNSSAQALDDGNFLLNLPEHFLFGCTEYPTVWINTNGYLTFNPNFNSYTPDFFPLFFPEDFLLMNPQELSIIAPFWTDIDLRYYQNLTQGHLYYQCYANTTEAVYSPNNKQEVFDNVTQIIQGKLGDLTFEPSLVCIITWEDVHPYDIHLRQDQTATFQVAITSDSNTSRSYIIFSYKSFAWDFINRPSAQGYQAGDASLAAYNLSTSLSALSGNLPNMKGNTGELGRWIFRTSSASTHCQQSTLKPTTKITKKKKVPTATLR